MARIDHYVWSAVNDGDTCAECRKNDGLEKKRKKDFSPQPPHPKCTGKEGCRCDLVGVYDDEGVVTLY